MDAKAVQRLKRLRVLYASFASFAVKSFFFLPANPVGQECN